MNVQDLTALYQLAQEAPIKAGQALEVAGLFQRVEQHINTEVVRSHVQAHIESKKPDPSKSTAVPAAPTAARSTPPSS